MIFAITGGTGFIGRRLVAELASAGHAVKVLTRRMVVDAPPGVTYVHGDLMHEMPSSFLADAEVLFHCAGEITDPAKMAALHIDGTRRLIDAAAGKVNRWVQLSSTGAYGARRSGEITETSALAPVGVYEETKAAADELVSSAARQGAFASVILRPATVFGADMPNRSLFAMLRMIDKGWFAFIGRPGASANYIHVANVTQALRDCALHPNAAGEIFNLSADCTMEQFVQTMASALAVAPPTRRIPEWPMRLAAHLFGKVPRWPLTPSRVDALTSFTRYPITKIEQTLGYRHRLTMAEGIADLVAGYRNIA